MFPQVKDAGLDLDALGEELLERKQELKEEGFAISPEEEMVGNGGRAASSSRSRRGSSSRRGLKRKARPQHRYKNGHDAGRGTRT
jgi:hypothetical protein